MVSDTASYGDVSPSLACNDSRALSVMSDLRVRSTDDITATKADVETHFASHGTGKITEIKLMNGFGFIEYEDAMDARDVVPGKSSSTPQFHRMADSISIP
jgi:hypothetical protein